MKKYLLPLCLLSGCATPNFPYLGERAVEEFQIVRGVNPWYDDGPGKVVTVYNPLNQAISVKVRCYSEGREIVWDVGRMPPKSERRGLVRVMNREQLDTVCELEWIQ